MTISMLATHPVAANAKVPVAELDGLLWCDNRLAALAVVNLQAAARQTAAQPMMIALRRLWWTRLERCFQTPLSMGRGQPSGH